MKRLQIPQKPVYEKLYVYEKILRTRNCRRKFIKNFLKTQRKHVNQTTAFKPRVEKKRSTLNRSQKQKQKQTKKRIHCN